MSNGSGIRGETVDEILFLNTESDPVDVGMLKKIEDVLRFKNSVEVSSLLTEDQHPRARQLIHQLLTGGPESAGYREMLPAGEPFPTQIIWWETSDKLKKIVEVNLTRNENKTTATEEWKVYDLDGSTVLKTITDTMSYTGVFETARTRVVS